jgi:hypothetical protein
LRWEAKGGEVCIHAHGGLLVLFSVRGLIGIDVVRRNAIQNLKEATMPIDNLGDGHVRLQRGDKRLQTSKIRFIPGLDNLAKENNKRHKRGEKDCPANCQPLLPDGAWD